MPGLGRIILAVLLAEVWQPLRRRDYHALAQPVRSGPGDPRAARQTATHPNRMGPWLHGMARREEQIELNPRALAPKCMHDVLRPLRVRRNACVFFAG